jgi:hypothetical protein
VFRHVPEEDASKHVDFDRERGCEQLSHYGRETSPEDRRLARALEVCQEVPPVYLE